MSNDRYFALPIDSCEPIRELPPEGEPMPWDDANVVKVRTGLPSGNVEVSIEGSYDTYELVVNMPVEQAVQLFREMLACPAAQN